MLDLYLWARGWPGPRGARVVELGVRSGVSTSAFLAALETDRKGHLWSFDIAPADVPQDFRDSEHWTFTETDGLGELALDTAPKEIDVLFIDLDPHSFEQTLTALTLWVPRIVPGGVALLHDTEWPEINYVRPGAAESEVGKALDVYCKMKDLEWRNKSGCNGLGILRVR
jgi:predicted O-methyltransferase YrrM